MFYSVTVVSFSCLGELDALVSYLPLTWTMALHLCTPPNLLLYTAPLPAASRVSSAPPPSSLKQRPHGCELFSSSPFAVSVIVECNAPSGSRGGVPCCMSKGYFIRSMESTGNGRSHLYWPLE